MKKQSWRQTFSGKQFWPLAPRSENICLIDIAWSLSQICRFRGHCNRFYSVLEHSLLVSKSCREYPLEGLFHDAAEAYLVDLPSPIKQDFPEIVKAENKILKTIFNKYDLRWPIPEEVIKIDISILFDEKQELMPNSPADWNVKGPGLGLSPLPRLEPFNAAFEFLRICELWGLK